ncbi:MAG: hypothetical protein ACTSQA_08565 [Candidatus Heimdallarchaeaceae archaeon]
MKYVRITKPKETRIGDNITKILINRSYYYSYGHVSHAQVSRVGRKYLYVKHFDIDNPKKLTQESQLNMDNYIVLKGLYPELRRAELDYDKVTKNYDFIRNNAMYDIDSKIFDIKKKMIKEWENENNKPKRTYLHKLLDENTICTLDYQWKALTKERCKYLQENYSFDPCKECEGIENGSNEVFII